MSETSLPLEPLSPATNETQPEDRQSASDRLSAADWALLALCAAAAAAYIFGHRLFNGHLPGIGLAVSHWALTIAVLVRAKLAGRLCFRHNAQGVLLLAVSLLLGAWYGIYADNILRAMNLPVLAAAGCLAVRSLTGRVGREPLTISGIREGVFGSIPDLFRRWAVPFKALRRSGKRRPGAGAELMLGLVIAIPVLSVAIWLLTSADEVFGSFMQGGLDVIRHADGTGLMKFIAALALTLMLFSWMLGALQRPRAAAKAAPAEHMFPELALSVTTALLDLVYAAFAAVQIRYLFLGIHSVRMAGGYAAYARSGFFQLTALAFLTILWIGPLLSSYKDSRRLRALCGATALLTAVIDISAFLRMRMYIGAFGLSLLRVLTLWAMAMILLSLILLAVKAVLPGRRVFPALAAVVLCTWTALNYANIDAIVARDQAARFNAGLTDLASVRELAADLSPDELPCWALLDDEAARQAADEAFRSQVFPEDSPSSYPSAYDWSLTWSRVRPVP